MIVKRVAGAIGAELQAINLGRYRRRARKTLRELLNEHEVFFLRDQSIEPEDKALAEIFALADASAITR